VLDRVNGRDGYSMKKAISFAATGASFHTKHASNANVVRVVLLDAKSYLLLCRVEVLYKIQFAPTGPSSSSSAY
jgi:hypothetical protein